VASVREHATVPYVIDGDGNCHVYVDAGADLDMALSIVVNAKTQRPGVCNAAESLLVHEAVAAEFLPITAAMLGAGDLSAILGADSPLATFIASAGGPGLAKAVSLGVAFAIINAMIAIALINARQLYASGRDGVWPAAVNRAMTALHRRFNSPWISCLVMGFATAAACLLKLDLLVMLTGTGIVVIYAGVSAAAIVGRINGTTGHGAYRMPLFPLAPVLALAALAAVIAADVFDPDVGRPSLIANVAVMLAAVAYYLVVLKRRGGWALRGEGGALLAAAQEET